MALNYILIISAIFALQTDCRVTQTINGIHKIKQQTNKGQLVRHIKELQLKKLYRVHISHPYHYDNHDSHVHHNIQNGVSHRPITVSYITHKAPSIDGSSLWKKNWIESHRNTCGRARFEPRLRGMRIIGGNIARKGSWPWMASMVFEPFRQHVCAGILIDPDWILTAAHCFDPPFHIDTQKFMTIRLGVHNSSYYSESANEQRRHISKIFKTPDYDRIGKSQIGSDFIFDDDIAIVKLDSAVELNDFVKPLCISGTEAEKNEKCVISGWGRQKPPSESADTMLDPSAWPQLLKQAVVPVVSLEDCRGEKGYENKLTNNMVCAGFTEGKVDSCAGDSGGPLQCLRKGRWEVVGITSWGGATYTECAKPHQPGVYTNVPRYLAWILTTMHEHSTG